MEIHKEKMDPGVSNTSKEEGQNAEGRRPLTGFMACWPKEAGSPSNTVKREPTPSP